MIQLTSGIALVIEFGFAIFCFVDALIAPEAAVRWLPRWGWALLILAFPICGAIAWLYAGRPWRARVRGAGDAWPASSGQSSAGRPPTTRSSQPAARPPRTVTPPGTSTSKRPAQVPRAAGLPVPTLSPEATLAEELLAIHEEHERTLRAWESDLRRREAALQAAQKNASATPASDA